MRALPSIVVVAVMAVAAVIATAAGASSPSPEWVPTPGSAFFSPTSVWNQPVEPNASIDPGSAGLVSDLEKTVNAQEAGKYGPWIVTTGFSTPIYTVPAGQPSVYVTLENINPYLQSAFASVPLPPDAQPASGTDGQLVVWQPSTETMWEFWHLHQTASGWSAKWGGAIDNMSSSPGMFTPSAFPGARTYWGATGSGLPLLGGLITIQDLEQGHIDHALSLGIPDPQYKVWSWPATRTDGQRVVGIPEGTHFRLNPTLDLTKLKLPPVALMIAQAAQRYGIIIRDFTPTVEFYAEDPTPSGGNPYPQLFGGQYPWQLLSKFPWGSLEALQQQTDTTPPTTTITSEPAKASAESSPTFTFSSSRPGSVFECEIDGAPYPTQCDSGSFTPSNLPDGWHQFRVKAIAPSGLAQQWATSYWWAVDTDHPVTTLVSKPPSLTNEVWAQFTFTGHDTTPSTFQCQLDNGGWSQCESGVSYGYLSPGSHTFQAQATDTAGNVEVTPVSYTWTVDTTPPVTTIAEGPPGVTSSSNAAFTVASSKPNSTIACSLDGGPQQSCVSAAQCVQMSGGLEGCSAVVEFAGLSNGIHTLEVQATDAAGNVASNPATYTWTVDTDAPATTLTETPGSMMSSSSASFAFSANDTTPSTFQCQSDGGPWFSCSSPLSLSGLADGSHTVQVRATDAAGNVEVTPVSYSWVVDTDSPVTTLTETPGSVVSSSSASFAFAANDTTSSTFQCQLDGGGWSSCSSPVGFSGLADGAHTFQVQATDAAGNAEVTPVSYVWTVDTDPPVTSISSSPPGLTNQSSASFAFAAKDTTSSTFQCQLDGGGWSSCSSPVGFSGLADGSHTFQVQATDAAGNAEVTPVGYSWTVDTKPPITTITEGPVQGISRTTSVSFGFVSSKAGSTFQCQLDGGGWSACSSPTVFSSLAAGAHTFSVQATDVVGNTDANPPTEAFFVSIPAAFSPESFLNAPLEPGAPAAESSALVAELQRQVNAAIAARSGPTIATTSGSAPIYTVSGSVPPVRVTIDRPTTTAMRQAFSAVPIPTGAHPTGGSGAQMIVWQPSTDSMWELRGMSVQSDGWHAAWGGALHPLSTNPGYFTPATWGVTGSAIPLLGGMMTVAELQSGRIDHALAVQIPSPRATQWSWPAQRTDGFVSGSVAIPEGARFRLDPTLNVASLKLSPLMSMLALAAQRYGIVVRGWAPQVTLYAEDPTPSGVNPYPSLFGAAPLWQQFSTFPWSRLQALPMSLSPQVAQAGRARVAGGG